MSEKKIKEVEIIKDSEVIIRDKNGYQPVVGLLNENPPSGGSGVPPINSTNNNEKTEDSNKKENNN